MSVCTALARRGQARAPQPGRTKPTSQPGARCLLATTLLAGALSAARPVQAAELAIRFLGLERRYLELAWQEAAFTEQAAPTLRLRVDGAGVTAVLLGIAGSARVLPANPNRTSQVLSGRVALEPGANRVRACAFTRERRASCFGIWILRVPTADQPPLLAVFEDYSFTGTEFVRGVVLGRGAMALSLQTGATAQPLVLDGRLDPRRSSHEFVAQVELEPSETQACFAVQRQRGPPVRRCFERAHSTPGSGRRMFAVVVTPPCDSSSPCREAEAQDLAQALELAPLGARGRVRYLTGEQAGADAVAAVLTELLGQTSYQDLLVVAYLGPLDVEHGGALALSTGAGGLALSLQTLLDLADLAPQAPPVLLLVEGLRADGSGSGVPELSARKPTCVLAASASGEPLFAGAQPGGALFAHVLVEQLQWTAAHPGEILCVEELHAALVERATQASEGTLHPALRCLAREHQHAFILPP